MFLMPFRTVYCQDCHYHEDVFGETRLEDAERLADAHRKKTGHTPSVLGDYERICP